MPITLFLPISYIRVILEKQVVTQLVKDFFAFYGNQWFIIVFTTGPYSETVHTITLFL